MYLKSFNPLPIRLTMDATNECRKNEEGNTSKALKQGKPGDRNYF
jgi:hypothetical protein